MIFNTIIIFQDDTRYLNEIFTPLMLLTLLAVYAQVTCLPSETFFQATLVCGTCDTGQNKVYDQIEMRCICNTGFYESQPGICTPCQNNNQVSYDNLLCRTVIGQTQNKNPNASSIAKLIPCADGESVFMGDTGQYYCVSDIRIRYEVDEDAGNVSIANTPFCNNNQNLRYSKRYKRCYNPTDLETLVQQINQQLGTNQQLQLSNAQSETFGSCQTGTSSLACSGALNLCEETLNSTSGLCLLYSSIQMGLSADVAQPFPQNQPQGFVNLTLQTGETGADVDLSGSNYQITAARIPRLQVQLTDRDGFILYQGNAFDSVFSLCSLLKAEQTNEAEYLFPQVSKKLLDRQAQFGLAKRLKKNAIGQSFQAGGLYGPTGESAISGKDAIVQAGFTTVFQGAGVLPRSSYLDEDGASCGFFRPEEAPGIFAQFYVPTENQNVILVPIYRVMTDPDLNTKILFPRKQWFLRALNMQSIFIGNPGYANGATNRLIYTTENLSHYLQHLEFHWLMRQIPGTSSDAQIVGPPIIIAKYAPLQPPDSLNGQYITDTIQTSNKALPVLNKNQLSFTFESFYHTINIGTTNIFKIICIVFSTLVGIIMAMVQLCKQTGEYPCGCPTIYKSKFKIVSASKRDMGQNEMNDNVMRTLTGNIVEERQSQVYIHYAEFFFYIIGFICLGFPVYYFFLELGNLISTQLAPWRREIFIKQYVMYQIPFEATLTFVGFLLFFVITVYRRTRAPVLFYSSRGDFSQTNRNGRTILLANKYQKMQKVRPVRFWASSILSIVIYIFLDLEILATRSTTFAQDFIFRPVQEKVLLYAFLHVLCCFLSCLVVFIKDLLFPSDFMKFQELCIISGMSCVIRDNNCTFCLIKGGSDIPVDQSIGSLLLLGQKLRKHFYEPSGVQVQRVYFNSRDETYSLIGTAMTRSLGLQNLRLRGHITEEQIFKIKQYSKIEIEAYETAIGMACQLDQICQSDENTGCCLPFFIVDVKRQSATKIHLFQRKYNPNTPFYQAVQYKSVTCYGLWFYELVFFNMLLWLFGSYFYSFSAVIILSYLVYYFYQVAINRTIQKTVSACNLVQKNFLGFLS